MQPKTTPSTLLRCLESLGLASLGEVKGRFCSLPLNWLACCTRGGLFKQSPGKCTQGNVRDFFLGGGGSNVCLGGCGWLGPGMWDGLQCMRDYSPLSFGARDRPAGFLRARERETEKPYLPVCRKGWDDNIWPETDPQEKAEV